MLVYQTLLKLSTFINRWTKIVIQINGSRSKCHDEIDKNTNKNRTKMESINTRSSNGKIQDTVRDNIKKAAYDECYDIIYKIRKQMDTDYNTLEKQLDELGESCEGLVDKFKDQVQKIVNV
jgi:hypothetical protein